MQISAFLKVSFLAFFSLIGLCPDLFIYLLQMTDQALFLHTCSVHVEIAALIITVKTILLCSFPNVFIQCAKRFTLSTFYCLFFRPLLFAWTNKKKRFSSLIRFILLMTLISFFAPVQPSRQTQACTFITNTQCGQHWPFNISRPGRKSSPVNQ